MKVQCPNCKTSNELALAARIKEDIADFEQSHFSIRTLVPEPDRRSISQTCEKCGYVVDELIVYADNTVFTTHERMDV